MSNQREYRYMEILKIVVETAREYKVDKYLTLKYCIDYVHNKERDNYHIILLVTENETVGEESPTKEEYKLREVTREELNEQIEVGKEWGILEGLIIESERCLRNEYGNKGITDSYLRARYEKHQTRKMI